MLDLLILYIYQSNACINWNHITNLLNFIKKFKRGLFQVRPLAFGVCIHIKILN